MIDSVRLILPNKNLKLKYEDRGKTTRKTIRRYLPNDPNADSDGYVNISEIVSIGEKEDLKSNGHYHPHIWQSTDKFGRNLVSVEFSIPKFIYGSNLFEFDHTSVNIDRFFIERLFPYCKKKIENLTRGADLFNAEVVRLDISKNVLFQETNANANWIIEQFSSLNMNNMNCAQKDYYDNKFSGKSVSHYNRDHAFKYYNKLHEIFTLTNKTKAEKDISNLLQGKKSQKILRFEVSLQNRNGVKRMYEKVIGTQKDRLILLDFWNKEICKRMLLNDLNSLYNDEFNLFTQYQTPQQSLMFVRLNELGYTVSQIKDFLMLQSIIKEQGPREAKNFLKQYLPTRTLSNYKNKYEEMKAQIDNFMPSSLNDVWKDIKDQVNEFVLITPDNFQNKLLIND